MEGASEQSRTRSASSNPIEELVVDENVSVSLISSKDLRRSSIENVMTD